ncbi:MAG: DUF4062 domain-containing protein [Rhizobium sp.]|nr:DUF4062 domain-containing protein [Rhizobium sp.]
MDVKYQVFVSSTFIDLQDERRAAIEAILNMGHIPVGMEAFQASDDTQWDYIKRRIDESDYYIVIVGERYGSEQDGKSYTQMEYEYAVAQGVPVAGFLLDPVARKSWPSDKVEFEKREKVESFRALCQQKLVKFWKNADGLAGRVAMALGELMRQKPRTGWVRADTVPSSRVFDELAALSEEKRRLQEKLSAMREDGPLLIPPDVLWRIKEMDSTSVGAFFQYEDSKPEESMLEVFFWLASLLAEGCSVEDFKERMDDIVNAHLDEVDVDTYLIELMTNSIVAGPEGNVLWGASRGRKVYSLTEYGKNFLMYTKEWRKRNDLDIKEGFYAPKRP